MLEYWKKLAIEAGFQGLTTMCVISDTHIDDTDKFDCFDNIIEWQPHWARSIMKESHNSFIRWLKKERRRIINMYEEKTGKDWNQFDLISKKYSEGIMSTLTKEVLNKGYQYYDWNVDSGDASFATNPHKLYNSVVNSISHDKYNVILMHDTKTYTRDALSNIIDYCLSNGYSFDSLDIDTMPIRQRLNN